MFRPETLRALEAVEQGGAIAEERIGSAATSHKEGRDVVTEADLAVEDAIRELLGRAFEYPVVGEERGGSAPADGSAYWLLDPICGTRNYASGLPLWCTNLALVEAGQLKAAAIYDALTREVQVAEAGAGAWARKDGSWRRLQASGESGVVAIEEGKAREPRRSQAATFMSAAIRADRWDVRSFATTATFPQLAAGRLAAYVTFYAGIEHMAAGVLVSQEAGAVVTQVDGRPWTLTSDSFIAAASRDLH